MATNTQMLPRPLLRDPMEPLPGSKPSNSRAEPKANQRPLLSRTEYFVDGDATRCCEQALFDFRRLDWPLLFPDTMMTVLGRQQGSKGGDEMGGSRVDR